MVFNVLVREEDGGLFWAEVKEIPGYYSCGPDLGELIETVLDEIGARGDAARTQRPSVYAPAALAA
jgi:hypothetical protein